MRGGEPLTVVVATRDRPDQLDACLAALDAGVAEGDEVIVVDSCSTGPGTAAVAAGHRAVLVRAPSPGASKARNLGWRSAQHRLVAFVDDDVRVASSWAEGVRGAFALAPDVAFVSGRLALRAQDVDTHRPVAFIDYPRPYLIEGGAVDDLGHGANLTVRREALESVGGYDERLGPGAPWPAAEDLELLDRLLAAGYRGRYEPAALAYHVQWRRRTDLPRLEWRYGLGQGARLARLRRLDASRYRALAHLVWRRRGTGELAGCLRRREELGTILVLARLAGTALGQVTAAAVTRPARRTW